MMILPMLLSVSPNVWTHAKSGGICIQRHLLKTELQLCKPQGGFTVPRESLEPFMHDGPHPILLGEDSRCDSILFGGFIIIIIIIILII